MDKETQEAKSRFRHFDGMAWPDPHGLDELAWRLTWSPDSVTQSDRLLLASLVNAYRQMVSDPRQKREKVCRQLRKTPA